MTPVKSCRKVEIICCIHLEILNSLCTQSIKPLLSDTSYGGGGGGGGGGGHVLVTGSWAVLVDGHIFKFNVVLNPLLPFFKLCIKFNHPMLIVFQQCVVLENIHTPLMEGFLFCTSSPPRKFKFNFIVFF